MSDLNEAAKLLAAARREDLQALDGAMKTLELLRRRIVARGDSHLDQAVATFMSRPMRAHVDFGDTEDRGGIVPDPHESLGVGVCLPREMRV